ncbi:MAG TPA: response regulator [Gemmatimonadales bacterium]|nr:response regulator [Gemmatimonadales bacterium]
MPTPHHLLVIDDEPFIGRIVRLEFERGPYRVSVAHDGDEGMRLLREHPDVEVVLLDVNMPVRSGLDLLEEARQDPHLGKVRFIVLTATGQSATAERAKALGAAAFVTKPFSPRKLLRQVAGLLGEPADGADGEDG